MLRGLRNVIIGWITVPVRMGQTLVTTVVTLRRFVDAQRRQLSVAILAMMMAVVGVALRHSGMADAEPADYIAMTFPDETPEVSPRPDAGEEPDKATADEEFKRSVQDTLAAIDARIAALAERPAARSAPISERSDAVIPASSQSRSQLPITTVSSATEAQPEPAKPEIAVLIGRIEFDDDDDTSDQ